MTVWLGSSFSQGKESKGVLLFPQEFFCFPLLLASPKKHHLHGIVDGVASPSHKHFPSASINQPSSATYNLNYLPVRANCHCFS